MAQSFYQNVSVDEKRRRIYIVGEADTAMSHLVFVALHKLEATNGPITIVINCEGGDETSGYAIYDAITMCKNVIIMEGYGYVGSIAAAIFQAADVRRMAPNAFFMIHNGEMNIDPGETKQNTIVDLADFIKKDSHRYYTILSSRSRMTYEEIHNACQKDTYYTAQEALEEGFCDEIINPEKKFVTPPKKRKRKK